MAQYKARAVPWTHGYELHITGPDGEHVGVTQSHSMKDAVPMVKDYIGRQLNVPVEVVGILLVVDINTPQTDADDSI
jgi:hypothetical protein